MTADTTELQQIYDRRFQDRLAYRNQVWQVLIGDFFQKHVPNDASVLDLGCGYGEFINNVTCATKYGMDLNPAAAGRLKGGITFFQHDCSATWPLPDQTLDVVFTSNFFEHLPDKVALGRTLDQCRRCLKTGGALIAMGPNIKFLPGEYWDFWDHHLPLTEQALTEALEIRRFAVELCIPRFLPYTMAKGPERPVWMLKLYLKMQFAWRIFGKQFLLIARK